MANRLYLIAILCLCSILVRAEKHALIIAIGDYPEDGYWPDISSIQDIVHIEAALKLQQFEQQNIRKLINEEATAQGISNALAHLVEIARSGDIIFVHFSGHGQQLVDKNGDEIDGLDEAIVPYDSPLIFKKGVYEGERLVNDDQLGSFLEKLRRKVGKRGQVVVILDSCHSGTGTRGMGKVRGSHLIMGDTAARVKSRGIESADDAQFDSNRRGLSPYLVLFGASASELNYETVDEKGNPVGSLSYAVSKVLSSSKGKLTFEMVFNKIRTLMLSSAPAQTPTWEGSKKQFLFKDGLKDAPVSFEILEIEGGNAIINGGSILGIYAGQTCKLVSLTNRKLIAEGHVLKSDLSNATISLSTTLNESLKQNAVVEVARNGIPQAIINVKADIALTSALRPLINRLFSKEYVSESQGTADLFIYESFSATNPVIHLETSTGIVLMEEEFAANAAGYIETALNEKIKNYLQGKYLRSIDFNEGLEFGFELLEAGNSVKGTPLPLHRGMVKVSEGQSVKVKVSNTGDSPGYFSIIDIQPDNVTNLIIPSPNSSRTPKEFYLKPGESWVTDYELTFYPPFGQDVFKLIASELPIDLRPLMSESDAMSRGGSDKITGFENAMLASFGTATRGGRAQEVVKSRTSTQDLIIEIGR